MARPGQNRFGAQPATATATGTQSGRNRGPGMNRGGGPGRKKGIPKGGAYGGKAGEALTNEMPLEYISGVMKQLGLMGNMGTDQSQWAMNVRPAELMAQYQGEYALNQNLSVEDFMRNRYGVEYGGKRGKNFKAGNAAAILGNEYGQYQSLADPLTTARNAVGGFPATGGNQDFQTFFNQNYFPGLKGAYDTARAGNQQMSFDQFLAGQDIGKQARKAYAYRSPLLRAPSPVDPTGRFSWWA